ncbi:MAG: hypothetical protein ACOYD3_11380, partial [Kiritimatiellia bacterium]
MEAMTRVYLSTYGMKQLPTKSERQISVTGSSENLSTVEHKTAPILIIAFNRPDLFAGLIDILRRIKPTFVLVAVDGPREDHPEDHEACAQVKNLTFTIDWPCEVRTRFSEVNQGCKHGPANAITWFFEQVDAGIILEDDCHPVVSFFPYASELLDRYAHHPEIGMISGNNHYRFQTFDKHSYYYSRLPLIYGWATWRRAWANFDITLDSYRDQLENIRSGLGHHVAFRNHWWKHVEHLEAGLDTWDVQWAIALFAHKQLCVKPAVNLVSNRGFNEDSTHTSFEYDSYRYESTGTLEFPLAHPPMRSTYVADEQADMREERRYTSEALAKPSRTQAVRLASGRFFAGFSMMRRGAAEQPGETGLFPC